MDELTWELLAEIQGRADAEILKVYFTAYGIEVELFQESLGQHIYPTTLDLLGNVQVFVAKKDAKVARKLLNEYYHPPEPEKTKRGSKASTATPKGKPAKSKTTKRNPK